MSSISNIQNLLVNVFRPTVAYDASTGYVPKVNLCNIDTISARSLAVTTFGLGDSNGNIFIGSNAGGSSSNTNNTVLGVAAGSGMANTTGSVYIGNVAGIGAQGASNVISIGYQSSGKGTSNIFIGAGTGAGTNSANNILIGNGLDFSTNNISNILQIGKPGSLVIQGDLANKRVGINTAPSYGLDVCGDFSFHNSNGSFTYSLDGTSNTLIDFRSSNVGKKAVLNVVGDVYGTTFYGDLSGGISTTSVKMGPGSISVPSYSFSNDICTGFYYTSIPPAIGTTVRGCNSMYITTTGVGIGTTNVTSTLDVSGILTVPSILNANYIRNALTPTTWDISGGNISNSATTRSSNFIGTTTASNSIGGVTLSNSNAFIGGFLRNALTPTTYDISGGNMFLQSNLKIQTITATGDISTAGTLYGTFVSTGINTSNIIVPGYIRNALTPTTLDISGGNISNSASTRSSNFITATASSNEIGGVTLNNSNILLMGVISGGIDNTSNKIGGVTLSNTNITYAGSINNIIASSSNNIGGVTLSNSNAIVGGFLRNALTPSTWDISGGNISNSGTHITANLITSGYLRNALTPSTWDISGGNISNSGTHITANLITSGYLRNALTPTTWDISGGNISNSGTTTSSNIRVGSGTVSVPSYAFSTDTSLGLYRVGANQLGFTSAGINRMTISGDRVGIGLTNPSTRFHVYNTSQDASHGLACFENNQTFAFGNGLNVGTSLTLKSQWQGDGLAPSVIMGELDCMKEQAANYGDSYLAFSTRYETNRAGGGGGTLSEKMRISGIGNVGIGTTAPSYRLDVSSAASNASINIATWPRTSMSNTFYGLGSTRSSSAVIYTTNTSIDSNLVTVGSNSGTYFTVNKSGIYSIVAFIVGSTGGTYDAWIDASTNIAHSGSSGTDTTIIVAKTGFNGEGRFTLSYSGYLPSNANMYYKTKVSANMTSITTARLQISFLQETPAYTGFFI